ncbi:MAG TPA: hypothetical protein VMR50_03560 [Myxococcota bacterium]|nr:hypothetical protein [Myxococcota bacterium]
MRNTLTAALCALALGTVACFPVPVPVPTHHDYEAEHHDPNIVIYDQNPGASRECWQHGDHWHCRR